MIRTPTVATLLLLLACGGKGSLPSVEDPDGVDADGDGFPVSTDCDDDDPSVNPGVGEVCDGIDNNCDGTTDQGTVTGGTLYYPDEDADGYGAIGGGEQACAQPDGQVAIAGDCDDADPAVHQDAEEVCDGVDNDCDSSIDETGATGQQTWYLDLDGDGYGTDPLPACEQPAGYAPLPDDCDDSDTAVHPGAPEPDCTDPTDYNCDGSVAYADEDGDGHPACEDCDDRDELINPLAIELCDGLDNDCDAAIDDADDSLDPAGLPTWYEDADADGYGADATALLACDPGPTYTLTPGDCDDGSATTAPGAAALELPTACTADADRDGYADAHASSPVTPGTDCDDAEPAAYPGAPETCAPTDLDCDGEAQEADSTDALTVYADSDGDSFGDPGAPLITCLVPAAYVADATDCDDTLATTAPGAAPLDAGPACAADADLDDYADASATGAVTPGTDCDDTDPAEFPGADEGCDGDDDDCDGTIDEPEAIDALTWYTDADADGHGDPATAALACAADADQVAPGDDCDDADPNTAPGLAEKEGPACMTDADADGYGDRSVAAGITAGTDCDDADGAEFPGADEVCDGDDDDCDGLTDEPDAVDAPTWYTDADTDGYGDPTSAITQCEAPAVGAIATGGDCDDANNATNPGAAEVCNDDTDNNCDSSPVPCLLDGALTTADAAASFPAIVKDDNLGWAVAGPGDVDGDGKADLLIGAPLSDAGVGNAGAAYLFRGGPTGSRALTAATATLTGVKNGDAAGSVLAGGDIDGDGLADLLIGAPTGDLSAGTTNTGATYLLYGPVSGTQALSAADAIFRGVTKNDETATALATVPDLNGDGLPALLIGAPGYDNGSTKEVGGAYLIFGGGGLSTSSLSGADALLVGITAGDAAGAAVAGADLNCDGLGDALVGAPTESTSGTDRGAAWMLEGPLSGTTSLSAYDWRRRGVNNSDMAGYALAGLGDVSGDGCDDVGLGAIGDNSLAGDGGSVFVFFGAAALTADGTTAAADARVSGPVAADKVGWSISTAGDVDGDGNLDLLLGAPFANSGLADNGAAYLVYGPLLGTLSTAAADATFAGPAATAHAGRGVALVGDTNNDGKGDLLVGADNLTVGAATGAGTAYLIEGLGL